MERIAIFIDAANFYYGLKSINPKYNEFNFDYEKFFETLSKNKKFIGFWYYTAPIKGNMDLNHKYQVLLSRLRKITGNHIQMCKRQKNMPKIEENIIECEKCKNKIKIENNDKKYTNKMDDVWLAIDMVLEAKENTFDTAILISGDSDIWPAVKKVIKDFNKKVHLIGFRGRTAYSLVELSNTSEFMDKKIVKKHFYQKK